MSNCKSHKVVFLRLLLHLCATAISSESQLHLQQTHTLWCLQTTMRVRAHADDVNAVCYAEDSPNIIVTGSDDSLIKV